MGAVPSGAVRTPNAAGHASHLENLVLYDIDVTASGRFRSATRHGVRFQMSVGPRRDPPSGRHLACSYQYRPRTVGAHPELVKGLMDGTVTTFPAHGNQAAVAEVAARSPLPPGVGRPDRTDVAQ
jgi:hypothetical protein